MKLGVTWCYLLFMLINHKSSNLFVSAKSLETQNLANCQHVTDFFKSFLNATIQPSSKVGECCDRPYQRSRKVVFLVFLYVVPVFIFTRIFFRLCLLIASAIHHNNLHTHKQTPGVHLCGGLVVIAEALGCVSTTNCHTPYQPQ